MKLHVATIVALIATMFMVTESDARSRWLSMHKDQRPIAIIDTLAGDTPDTIFVTVQKSYDVDNFSLYIVPGTPSSGTSAGFQISYVPAPDVKLDFSVLEADTMLVDSKETVNFRDVVAGSLPVPIAWRDGAGAGDATLDFDPGELYWSYVTVASSGSEPDEFKPPQSGIWMFIVFWDQANSTPKLPWKFAIDYHITKK